MDEQAELIANEGKSQTLTLASYTVDALLEKLGVTANIQVWKSIDTIVYVQGVVGKVKPYNRVVYFDLRGGSTTVTVKCPLDLRPQEGDNIIVEGLPMLRPSRFTTGLDVIIEGKPVANIEPPKPDTNKPIVPLEKNSFIRLQDYLGQHGFHNICIAGTETAMRDVLSQIHHEIRESIQTEIIRVSEKETMLSDLHKAISGCDAFAIVRGGDDASLELWNDPEVIRTLLALERPFYVALGHTHFVALTTQYADESFHTPSDFGAVINEVIQRMVYDNRVSKEVEALKKNQIILEKDMSAFQEREKKFLEKIDAMVSQKNVLIKQKNRSQKMNLVLLVVLIIILAALFAPSLWP